LVQLKGGLGAGQRRVFLSFNSTLVQLKVQGIRYYELPNDMFQFHIGTIKSERIEFKGTSESGFNSTLVQLKGS